jgi:hypothetical protein
MSRVSRFIKESGCERKSADGFRVWFSKQEFNLSVRSQAFSPETVLGWGVSHSFQTSN